MGYESDQFYAFPNVGRTDNNTSFTNRNERFAFPGPSNKSIGPNGKMRSHPVQRGFMRVLTTDSGTGQVTGSLATKQCFFQFNPQTISRSVQITEGMMNPLLQDVAQFSAPTPGKTNFSFSITFDRQFELMRASSSDFSSNPITSPGGLLPGQSSPNADDLLATKSASEIGVLADMRVFDSIVGVGITRDLIDYIYSRAEIFQSLADKQAAEDLQKEINNGASPPDPTSITTGLNEVKVREILGNNVGNQAFLFANPVRIVFSSLFMVDGFIQGVNVSYVKFTENMVPSQCVVSISMQAVYLGFARTGTYLEYALQNAAPVNVPKAEVPTNTSGDAAAIANLKGIVQSFLNKYKIGLEKAFSDTNDWDSWTLPWKEMGDYYILKDKSSFYTSDYVDGGPSGSFWNYEDAGIFNDEWKYNHYDELYPGILGNTRLYFKYGFSDIPELKNSDPIYNSLAGSNPKNLTIKTSWKIDGYRKWYGGQIDNEGNKVSSTDVPGVKAYLKQAQTTLDLVKVFSAETADTASSAQEWDAIRRKKGVLLPNTAVTPSGNPHSGKWTENGRMLNIAGVTDSHRWDAAPIAPATKTIAETVLTDVFKVGNISSAVIWKVQVNVAVTDNESKATIAYSQSQFFTLGTTDPPIFEMQLNVDNQRAAGQTSGM